MKLKNLFRQLTDVNCLVDEASTISFKVKVLLIDIFKLYCAINGITNFTPYAMRLIGL